MNESQVLIARGSLGGTTVRTREAGGFTLSETRHPAGMRLPCHANDRATLVAVLAGAYVETVGNQTATYLPGALLLRPPGEVHSNTLDARGSSCLLVELSAHRLNALDGCGRLFASPRAFSAAPAAALARRAADELTACDEAAPLALEALALELLATLTRFRPEGGGQPPAWLERLRDTVHETCAPVTLTSLAHSAGHAPVYVARVFRRHFGCSIGEYLRRRRIERACEAMVSSSVPLSRVALDAGFFDQSHFSRVFRRLMGITPAEYRRLHGRVRYVPEEVPGVLEDVERPD